MVPTPDYGKLHLDSNVTFTFAPALLWQWRCFLMRMSGLHTNAMIHPPHPCRGRRLVVALLWVWVLLSTSETRGTVLVHVLLSLRCRVLDKQTRHHMNLKAIGLGLQNIEHAII